MSAGGFPTPTPKPQVQPQPQPDQQPTGPQGSPNAAMQQDGNQNQSQNPIMQALSGPLNNLSSLGRYGMTHDQLYSAMLNNKIPGMPQMFLPGGAEENPEADRYAGNYVGAKTWGAGPATAFNMIALGDIPKLFTDPKQVLKNKLAGIRGAIAGQNAAMQPGANNLIGGIGGGESK